MKYVNTFHFTLDTCTYALICNTSRSFFFFFYGSRLLSLLTNLTNVRN